MAKFHFGKAFPDELNKVRDQSRHFKHKNTGDWQEGLVAQIEDTYQTPLLSSWRKVLFTFPVLVIFCLLLMRLLNLQVVEGAHNRDLADSNRIKVKVIHAPRGVIYDRKGKILAQNEPAFRLVEASGSATAVQHLSRDQALAMEVSGDPNYQNLEIDSERSYPMGEETAHILGYNSEITGDELKDPKFQNYALGDKIGRGGIEQAYESTLKGVDGGQIIEVDAKGNPVRTLREVTAIPGHNIYLSIDANLQDVAYKNLLDSVIKNKSCCGALVAENPDNGEILAMASIPSYDPKNIIQALTADNSPLLNRSIGGTYPPGSTFKIASSLAGLESGKITATTQFEDTGVMHLGPYSFANWYFTDYGKTEGQVNVVKALQRSNDIYYYNLGNTVGETTLGNFAKKLGLGEKLGIDIPGETKGLIPDDQWKVANTGEVWYPGDTLHMAIGQGYVLTTPLQINNLVSTVAADGKQYPPHLALKITDSSGSVIKQFKYDPISNYKFQPQNISLVKTGLEEVPKYGGTAWPFFTFPIPTAGKTGTAEIGDPQNRTHAWYTSYAPADNPQIAMTVLVEKGGEGSNVAAPVAKEVYRWYFSKDKNNLLKDLGWQVATESARALGE